MGHNGLRLSGRAFQRPAPAACYVALSIAEPSRAAALHERRRNVDYKTVHQKLAQITTDCLRSWGVRCAEVDQEYADLTHEPSLAAGRLARTPNTPLPYGRATAPQCATEIFRNDRRPLDQFC